MQQTHLFVSGSDGYDTYRIPSLIVTKRGTVLAFCEGRKNSASDTGDIDLLLKRSADGGETWSDQQTVWDDGPNTCGNPCPVVDEDTGTIWLLLTHNRGEDSESGIVAGTSRGTRTVWVTHSEDDGLTWAEPVEITETAKAPTWTWYATGPGVGIQLRLGPRKGRLVIPCDHMDREQPGGYFSHVIYSDDHGETWQLGGATADGVNECQVIERADGSLLLNMRNYRKQARRMVANSDDGGLSWSEVTPDPMLAEPVCQASLIRYSPSDSGEEPIVLFSNPAHETDRSNMTVRLSQDDGRTWPVSKVLHAGPSAYSCLSVLPDGSIGCLYEGGEDHRYEKLVLARFTLDWITER